MRKGELSKEQAISIVGSASVEALERENCDFTNRLMDESDDAVEFSASIPAVDQNNEKCTVTAYFYPTQAELDNAGDDLSNVDWKIHGYEVR